MQVYERGVKDRGELVCLSKACCFQKNHLHKSLVVFKSISQVLLELNCQEVCYQIFTCYNYKFLHCLTKKVYGTVIEKHKPMQQYNNYRFTTLIVFFI